MFDQYDVLAVVGVGVLAGGMYMALGPWAMLVTIGLALLIVGMLGAWRAAASTSSAGGKKPGQGDKVTR